MPLDGDFIKKVLMVFQQNAEEKPNSLCMDVSEISDRTGFSIAEISICLEQLGVIGMAQYLPETETEFKWAIAPDILATIRI